MRAYIESILVFGLLVVALRAAVAVVAFAVGLPVDLVAMVFGLTVGGGSILLTGGAMLTGDGRPGPARCVALATGLWAAAIPVLDELARREAHVDPDVGWMPYDIMPLYGEPWFQASVFAALAAATAVLAVRWYREEW
ncbi:hypothetical protein [Azospirillum canadense]|uniref:hypothetical protein n=1 Tax=Azospirillum canadense TaxID=403962 RepID=UPI0022278E8B|nr:hypothetical protein [Azospirillum canadense]MCW2240725.1 hypothetical protein [Azospirillum canadense]